LPPCVSSDLSDAADRVLHAARAILGITAAALAERSGVDLRTLQRFEAAEGVPKSRLGNLQRIKETLEGAGILFLGDPLVSPGVPLKQGRRQARRILRGESPKQTCPSGPSGGEPRGITLKLPPRSIRDVEPSGENRCRCAEAAYGFRCTTFLSGDR
jgi:transcriptional regulator with XRE-family HTH domain